MAQDGAPRRYKVPCRACGDYRVKIVIAPALEPGKELVIGTCGSCESIRCRYYRLIRPAPRST